jgi:lipoprotein-anchoring transpeptidase ErfK/SrfK
VGTGTGLRLEGPDGEWDFSTPDGIFHVQYKEESPVWMAPDWYFIENKLPVPPPNDAKRRFPGGLGAAAVYIGEGLAIHGTTSRTCWASGCRTAASACTTATR